VTVDRNVLVYSLFHIFCESSSEECQDVIRILLHMLCLKLVSISNPSSYSSPFPLPSPVSTSTTPSVRACSIMELFRLLCEVFMCCEDVTQAEECRHQYKHISLFSLFTHVTKQIIAVFSVCLPAPLSSSSAAYMNLPRNIQSNPHKS